VRGDRVETTFEGEREPPAERWSTARTLSVGAATLAVIALAGVALFVGSSAYTVKARFINAGQLVKGNPVQSGGVAIGSVDQIKITDDGQAEITLKIKDAHTPLREGTQATIRQFSLSGIANRYVDLRFPKGSQGPEIPDGGEIGTDRTSTAVDLDQLFNTLDPKTRKALQDFFKGSARQWSGRGNEAAKGFEYLNPALSTSRRLFNELTRDTPVLERFLVDSSRLVTSLAERRDDLAALIGNLNETTRALGNRKAELAQAVENLPPFMRQANSTFVDLRFTLDQVDPLVEASKPVARRLGPFLDQARAFAAGAEPTVRDLSKTIRKRGRRNDLVELLRSVPRLANIAVEERNRRVAPGGRRVSVGKTRGAFEEGVEALRASTPELAFARPYTNDLLGWFDDFSTTGAGYDALGAFSRASLSFSEALTGPTRRGQYRRCPGGGDVAAPDGSNVMSSAEQERLSCKEAHRGAGP
jgi:phospholipid/cholesterol/gamma-HCH transport system substrate-binding protein